MKTRLIMSMSNEAVRGIPCTPSFSLETEFSAFEEEKATRISETRGVS